MNTHREFRETDYELVKKAKRLLISGNLNKTEILCLNALRKNADNVDAYELLAHVAQGNGQTEEAIKLLSQALEITPNCNQINLFLASLYHDNRNFKGAIKHYQSALDNGANNFPLLVNLSNAYLHNGELEESVLASEKVLKKYPKCAEAYSNLGQAYIKSGSLGKAYQSLSKSVELAPENTQLINNFGVIQQLIGDLDGCIHSLEKSLQINPKCRLSQRNLKCALLNSPRSSEEEIYKLTRFFFSSFNALSAPSDLFIEHNFDVGRKLRVGYLSSDLYQHPVANNILPLIACHNRSEIEVHIFSLTEINDSITEEFKMHSEFWTDVSKMSDFNIAKSIKECGIDILIYVAGSFNLNRPEVGALRPAPLQISFHDCISSGLDAIDYWLTDLHLHPNKINSSYSENLFYLPTFYQYSLPNYYPHVSNWPFRENGYITFGSFNKLEKISNEVIELWSKILLAVPNSKLLLKYRSFLSEQSVRNVWIERFSKFNIPSERLLLISEDSSLPDHLALYSQVDIALDPFPFNGSTTTFEALLMGVPVISLEGKSFISRVSSALLKISGLREFIAPSTEIYIEIAMAASNKIKNRKLSRSKIRSKFLESSLCDNEGYTKEFQLALRKMWKIRCDEEYQKKTRLPVAV